VKIWNSKVQVTLLEGCRMEFICPAGHKTVVDYSKGKVAKRLSRSALKLLERYWRDRVTFKCKKCPGPKVRADLR